MDLSYSCPFSFPSSKSVLRKVSKLLLLSPSPNGKKTFCKPLDSYLVRKGPGDSVRKAGLVGGQPSKQARAQIGETLIEVTQRNWLIGPAATKKHIEQNVVVSRTSDDAVGKLVFNGNWEVRLGKMSGVAF